MYSNVVNDPMRRRIINSHAYWDNAFTSEELTNIELLCNDFELKAGITFGSSDISEVEKIRKSDIHFFNRTEQTSWIFERFNHVIDSLNRDFFGLNLNGYSDIQYTVYRSSNEGKYDYHIDCGLGEKREEQGEMRKLSLVMLLSEPVIDFSGGELQIKLSDHDMTLDMWKGRIVAFPSFILHRVRPVHLGIRKSLVIWVEGPKFV